MCSYCGKPYDGTEVLGWYLRCSVLAGKNGEVDMEKEMARWREVNAKIEGMERVCEKYGKLCRNGSGMAAHMRRCGGDGKEMGKKVRVRPFVDV